MRSLLLICCLLPLLGSAQENYEIQVYASPTMSPGMTIFELHSNYTFDGERTIKEGVRPSFHSLHETVEITHGIAKNFELGFYLFTNYTSGYGWQIVGTHLRPRFSVPQEWKWPVGVSLSSEIGYQRKEYSSETWNIEIRPIIDKQLGKLYLSFNPTFGVQLKGYAKESAPAFAPNFKAAWSLTPVISIGPEYYGDVGAFNNWETSQQQNHALYAVVDLFVDPKWEINFGPGWGLTPATDGFLFKLILGRRVTWKKKNDNQK
jgi:hypothetical protein